MIVVIPIDDIPLLFFLQNKTELAFSDRFSSTGRTSEPIKSNSELHHDLLVLNTVVFHVTPRILVHIKRIHNAKRQLIRLAFSSKATGFLDRDDLRVGIELIQEVDEEFVQQLANRGAVSRLANILLFNHLQITFEKGICFNHAENSRVWIAALTVPIVGPPSLFRLEFLDRNWIVDCFGLLTPQFPLLQTWQDGRLSTLAESNDHQSQSIG